MPADILRGASAAAAGRCDICLEEVRGSGRNNLRLGCRCLLHFDCLSSYIKAQLGDSAMLRRRGGITCPCSGLGCSRDGAGAAGQPAPPYVLGIDEISLLADYYADAVSSGALEAQTIPLTREDAERLRRFMDEPAAPPSKVRRVASDETWPYIETTTKQCPNCTNRESHFHGHACHHVTCTSCQIAYCYKCAARARRT